MKKIIVALGATVWFAGFAATPTITAVTAQQRYPWNGKVDISYTVTGDIVAEAKQRALITSLKVTATDRDANATYTATKLSGDMLLTAGTHSLVWDMDAEGLTFKSTNVVFKVSCETTNALYCVIDLSAGANATSYPVTYLASPPSGGFNVDAYKTTKLVLRRIEPGSFMMGGSYNVTLTRPFFIGIFEVTQKQYTLVAGSNPSFYNGDKRPVDILSYATWSKETESSIIRKLQAKTGLPFDLPTEAQWEYACRSGTTSSYNNGGNTVNDLKKLGRYKDNCSDGKGGYSSQYPLHTTVGSYEPNAWGVYDMHGNAWEWCRDAYGNLAGGTDPINLTVTNGRVVRGGCWGSEAKSCTSSSRGNTPWNGNNGNGAGARLSWTQSN